MSKNSKGYLYSIQHQGKPTTRASGFASAENVSSGDSSGGSYVSNITMDISHTHKVSGTTDSAVADSGWATPKFSGKTGGSTWVAPTFTGSAGTTSDATAGGSVSSHSHSLSLTTSNAGTATGGTHGKLLGMNYIIKT